MTLTTRARTRVPLTIGLTAAALITLGACGAKTDSATPTTTAAAGAKTTTTAGASGATTTAAPGTSTTTAAAKKEVGNPEIKAALSASNPELWALVDYNIMSWDTFSGFNIPLKAGSDQTKALPLCEAVSKVVYDGGASKDTSIVIAVGTSDTDITGTPVVSRKNAADTCKPA